MIGKMCFKGQIAFRSKHVKSYLIELNICSPNSQELVLQTRTMSNFVGLDFSAGAQLFAVDMKQNN